VKLPAKGGRPISRRPAPGVALARALLAAPRRCSCSMNALSNLDAQRCARRHAAQLRAILCGGGATGGLRHHDQQEAMGNRQIASPMLDCRTAAAG